METKKETDVKEPAEKLYKKVGLLDENTDFGKCFKEYMDDMFRHMLCGGNIELVPNWGSYKLTAFKMGYFSGVQIGEWKKYDSEETYLELKVRDYLQTVYTDPSIKFFYAVLAECCCELVFEYGNIRKEVGSVRTEGLVEAVNCIDWDGKKREVIYNNDKIDNGRIIIKDKQKNKLERKPEEKPEDDSNGNSIGNNYCYYYEDLQDIFKLLGRESYAGYRLTRLLLPKKVNKMKKVAFDYNYQCGEKTKNSVISDYYLERVIGLKELVILRTFLDDQRLSGKGVDQAPIIDNIKKISGLKKKLRNNSFIYLGILPNILSIAEGIYSTRLDAIEGLAKVLSKQNNEICKEAMKIAEYSFRMKQYIMNFLDIEKYLISAFEEYDKQVSNSGIHLAKKLDGVSKILAEYIQNMQCEKTENLQKAKADVELVARMMYKEIECFERYDISDTNLFLSRLVSVDRDEAVVMDKVEKVMFWKEGERNNTYKDVMNEFGNLAREIHSRVVDRVDIENRVKGVLGLNVISVYR